MRFVISVGGNVKSNTVRVFYGSICLAFAQDIASMHNISDPDSSQTETALVNDDDLSKHTLWISYNKQEQKAYRELSDAKMDLDRFEGYFNLSYKTQPQDLSEPELQAWKASREEAISERNTLLARLNEAEMEVAKINQNPNTNQYDYGRMLVLSSEP